jgi:hypothetical protein
MNKNNNDYNAYIAVVACSLYSLLCSLNLKMNREVLEQVLTRIRSVSFFAMISVHKH